MWLEINTVIGCSRLSFKINSISLWLLVDQAHSQAHLTLRNPDLLPTQSQSLIFVACSSPLWILFTFYSILHPQYGQNSSPFNGAIRKALWQKGQRFLIAIIIRSTISNAKPVSAYILQSAIHEIKIKKPNMMPTILQIVLNNLNELMILFPPTASYFNKLIS